MTSEFMTDSQILEQRITDALVTIRRDHGLLLPTKPKGAMPGLKRSASLIKHADDAEHADDIDGLTRRIDSSHHVTHMVNGWVRLVVEDASVTTPPIRCDRVEREPITLTWPHRGPVPIERTRLVCRCGRRTPLIDGHLHWLDGANVPDMCTFLERWARWASGHEAAEDMADELEGLVTLIRQYVPELLRHEDYRPQPVRRLIGRCTEEIEHEDETIAPCAGRVFAYPDGDGTDADDHDVDDPWAICERCGSRAVTSVWQKWMFPEVAEQASDVMEKMRDRVLSVDEVLNLAHREFGRPASRQALWQWVSRGHLAPIDKDTKPHTFRLGDVVDMLAAKVG